MSPWCWYWKEPDDESYGFEGPTRDAAIANAVKELKPGDRFEIIEARMSEAQKHWESDYIPFLRSRNHEVLIVPQPAARGEGE